MGPAYKKRRFGPSEHDEKTTEKMNYVPEEIQRQIMLRLPVKSLMRFYSLNKRSHSLISTQQFISHHMITFRPKNKRQFLLFSSPRSYSNQDFQYVDGSVRPICVQDLAPPPIGPVGELCRDSFRVIGYCDGVVCMIRSRRIIQLWNPSIRKMTIVFLYCSILRDPNFRHIDDYTFGFGSVDGEHKLVVFPKFESCLSPAYVFSLKTRNWATVQRHQRWRVTSRHYVFVNGACHWLARAGGVLFVSSFNLKEHTFVKIDLPNFLDSVFELSNYDGCLSFIARVERSIRSSVWVMTKYCVVESWIRIMENKSLTNLQDIVGFIGGDAFGLAYCRPDYSKTRLVCYKPTRQRAEWLKADVKNLIHLNTYEESLVLLDQPAYVHC